MAYPFTEMPTLGEFLSYLQERSDCTIEKTDSYVQTTCSLADGGQPVRIKNREGITRKCGATTPHSCLILPQARHPS